MIVAVVIGLIIGAAIGFVISSAIACGLSDDAFRAGYRASLILRDKREDAS